jgi:Fe2+ or Zn2+ uptake regulation protein
MSERIAGLKHQTAYRIIALLKEEKILSTIVKASGRTPEVLVFDDLFELIR